MDSSDSWFKLPKKLGGAPVLTYVIGLILSLSVATPSYFYINGMVQKSEAADVKVDMGCFPIVVPQLEYGFALDTFQVLEREIASGEVLSDILLGQGLSYPEIEEIVRKMDGIFSVNQLRAGKSYKVLTKDSTGRAEHIIYEPSVYEFYDFDLRAGQLAVKHTERPVEHEIRTASGAIQSSL